jgi:hypothetical protein
MSVIQCDNSSGPFNNHFIDDREESGDSGTRSRAQLSGCDDSDRLDVLRGVLREYLS